jgi:tRNA modification GTPase
MTARGVGGIAVIRLAGAGAGEILRKVFVDRRMRPREGVAVGRIAYGFIVESGSGEPVDEVLVARVGEDAYEVNCHGGLAAVNEVMRVLGERGAAEVDAEEALSRGGILAGRDAVQREAYRLILRARSERAVRHLVPQFEGALSREIARLIALVQGGRRSEAASLIDDMLKYARFGVALSEPPRVVIAGRPNAGKSSLLNALLGRERVIVDAEPGTTRDVVEDVTLINGVPFTLCDTAGLREAAEEPEIQGVQRARTAAEGSDCLIVVFDLSRALLSKETDFFERAAGRGRRVIACVNKCDLAAAWEAGQVEAFREATVRRTSCVTREGMEEMREAIYERCIPAEPAGEEGALIFSRGQAEALSASRAGMADGKVSPVEAVRMLERLLLMNE